MYSEMATSFLMVLCAFLAFLGGWELWGRRLRDARGNADTCARHAREVEKRADALQQLVSDCPRCSRRSSRSRRGEP